MCSTVEKINFWLSKRIMIYLTLILRKIAKNTRRTFVTRDYKQYFVNMNLDSKTYIFNLHKCI